MKKLLAGALIFITVFFSSGSAVSAATIDELQAQLNALLLQISQLQGQGSASPATPALANASANASFNRNLNFGLKNDPDVMRLQALLGVDQTGNFGPLTQAAVRTFQASNGIDSTGFVGPQTREALGLRLVEPEVVDYRPSAPANPSSTPSNVSISGVTVTKSFGPLPCQATAPTAGISLKPGAPFCMYIWAHNTNDSERLVKIDMPANDPKLNFSDATRQFILQPGRFGYMNVISSVKSSATPGTYSSPTSVSVVGVSGSGYFPSGSGTVYANIGIVDTSAITPTATDNTSTPKVELYVNGVRSSTTISNGGYVILSWKYYNMSSGCTVGV
ncbi:MAG: peptidoglycan-binding domain-containing protein, partial [Patescibacteria group bacterium]